MALAAWRPGSWEKKNLGAGHTAPNKRHVNLKTIPNRVGWERRIFGPLTASDKISADKRARRFVRGTVPSYTETYPNPGEVGNRFFARHAIAYRLRRSARLTGPAVCLCMGHPANRLPLLVRKCAMRLGLFMMPLHPPARPLHETLEEDTAKALMADQLGFNELWVGEHFSARSEPIPSPLMFMASLIHRTTNLTFATGVLTLPHRHPAVIAAEIAQFDNMSRGRFLLGIGAGSLPSDFELLGTFDQAERGRRVIESVDLMQRIWSETPPYDMQGNTWRVKLDRTVTPQIGFGAMPHCFQEPHPPIFVPAVSANSRTLFEAGRRGWWPISSALPLPSVVTSHWDSFVSGCDEADRPPDPSQWRVVRTVLVASTDQEARARLYHADGAYRFFYTHLRTVLGQVGMLSLLRSHPEMSDDEITVELPARKPCHLR